MKSTVVYNGKEVRHMIYLDNAATTWPKPPAVITEMQKWLIQNGGNPGRGGHAASMQAARSVYEVREEIANLFGAAKAKQVVFASNATHALNQALFGLLEPGDHVLTSSLEHNAVARPLWALQQRGVQITEVPGAPGQEFDLKSYASSFQPNTKLVVTLHASNVTGALLPVQEIGEIARAHGVPYLLDAAQTAGVFEINMRTMPIDLVAFPGHKGLLGPQGTGGLVLGPNIELKPLIYGGTGSLSERDEQPDFLPDRLESGTLNGVGIAGLGAGVRYLLEHGIEKVREREQLLCQRLLDGLVQIPGIKVYGGLEAEKKAPIVSFNIGEMDSMFVSYRLDELFGVTARAGLHCAPHAHRLLGTLDQGVVRFSPSHFSTEDEIEEALAAVREAAMKI